MSRYKIEDIVSQNKRGIVFRAHDSEKGHTVALRRFFPFGQDGGGLKEEETAVFLIAAQRLAGVSHPALRSVFSGAVDPIDNMPYIVVEWVDGAKLCDVLNGEALDPRLVIQVLQLALEVSLTLSKILGEEAVWVETDADSIFVGSEESGRGFVFWLSPFKWLGAEFESRKLAALVEMGERLAGWKGKLIGNNAGYGLGGWLKWMKNNPDASLAEALESLPAFASDDDSPPPPKPPFAAPIARQSAVKLKSPSSISPLMITACTGLLVAVAELAYYHLTAEETNPPPKTKPTSAPVEQPLPVVVVPQPKPTSKPTAAPAEDAEAIAISRVQEMAEKLAREKEKERAAALAPPVVAAPPLRDFTAGDGEKMKKLNANSPASVTGVVLNVRLSESGKSLYFEFSKNTNATEIMAVAHKSDYKEKDDFTVTAYRDLIGKKMRFDGTVFKEPTGKQYVMIRSREKMKDVK